MGKYLMYIIAAAVIFAAAFGVTEYLDGYGTLDLPKETDVYKFRDEQKGEDRSEFYEGEKKAELLEVLSGIKIKHYKTKAEAIQGDDVEYRIYLYNGEKNYFIYLGEQNLVSEGSLGSGGNAYDIINPEEIIAEIDSLLKE